jgi:Family of unknown function (DUF5372)
VGTTTRRKILITHPFHPLAGRKIDFVCRRQYWGEDRIVYLDRHGRIRWIAASWTDIDPADDFRAIAAGRAAFRTIDLLELHRTLARIAAQWADDV